MRDKPMQQVLAELELCSTVRASNMAGGTGGGKPGSVILSLTEKPPAEYWRQRWARARDDEEREDVRKGALVELKATRVGPGPVEVTEETMQERTARILARKNEGWSAKEVALSERVTERQVMDARTEAGLDPALGKAWPEDEDRNAKIHRLRAGGMSIRAIAKSCGVGVGTVHNVLGQAA